MLVNKINKYVHLFILIFLNLSILKLISYVYLINQNINILNVFIYIMLPINYIYVMYVCNLYNDKIIYIIIFMFSFTIPFITSICSEYIIGVDVHREYHLYTSLKNSNYWNSSNPTPLNSCLSINMLPMVVFSLMGISNQMAYKIFFSLISSFIPIFIFLNVDKYFDRKYSVLSLFIIISQYDYIYACMLPRQVVAVTIYCILFYTLSSIKKSKQKTIIITMLGFSTIIFHYSTSYIILITLIGSSFVYILFKIYKKNLLIYTILYLMLTFIWSSFIGGRSFDSVILYIERAWIDLLKGLFSHQMRGDLNYLLGYNIISAPLSIKLEFITSWLIIIFISIGNLFFIFKILNYKIKNKIFKNTYINVYKSSLNNIQIIHNIIFFGLMISIFILPSIIQFFSWDRLYHISTPVIIFSYISGYSYTIYLLTNSLKKLQIKNNIYNKPLKIIRKSNWIILLSILILHFYSVSGITYELNGIPKSINFNSESMQYKLYYINKKDSISSRYYYDFGDLQPIHYDTSSHSLFISQSQLFDYFKTDFKYPWEGKNSILYMRTYNTLSKNYISHRHTTGIILYEINYDILILDANKIYDNGASQYWTVSQKFKYSFYTRVN